MDPRASGLDPEALASLSSEELSEIFRPDAKYEPVLRHAQGPTYRIGLFYQAAWLETFGRPAPYAPLPHRIAQHIAKVIGETLPDPFGYPDARATFFAHAEKARRILGWRKFDRKLRAEIERWLAEEARRSDDPDWLSERLEVRLREGRIELPARYRLERMVSRARVAAQEWIARSVASRLTSDQLTAIDDLRKLKPSIRRTLLQWLKDPVGPASPNTLDDLLDRLDYVRAIQLPAEAFERVHPDMRRRLAKTVEVYSVDNLYADFPTERRQTFVAVYLHERQKGLVDLAVEAFDGVVLGMNRRSEADLAEDQRQRAPAINEKLRMFLTLAGVVLDPDVPDPMVRPEIFKKIPRETLLRALAEAEELVRPPDYNCFDYLEARYPFLRSFFPRFLRTIEFEGTPGARPILEAVGALRHWNAEGVRKVPASAPIAFVPEKWLSYVCPAPDRIDRHYYEICLLMELHRALQAAEVWATGGRRYGNVEDLLIPKETWAAVRDECYEELGLPKNPKSWMAEALATLGRQIEKTLANLPANPQTFVEGNRVHLRALELEPLPERVQVLKDRVKASWREIRIQDLLVQVNSWVGLGEVFRTLRGRRGGAASFDRGLLAALIAKGCNIGLVKMSALTPGVTQGSLRRVDEIYLYEDTLRRAYELLQGAQHRLPVADMLGDETVSMSDGWKLLTRVGTLRASLHPDVFGPGQRGITYYWHVSHQGPAYAAQVIGHDRDAAYVLDQILHIQSELPINEHYTDTHGSTENTFGLTQSFGAEFSPRIKLVHEQDLYHPPGMKVSGPMQDHFAGAVDVDLIERHWDDYVRILASIKRGHTSAVLLSLRLSSYARQNPLYRALREVGRIWKTRFIMRYYDEPEYRRRINAGLNRMELFNYLARHLFYARRGENWEREFEQQLNRASALLILANACVLWNSVHLSELYKQLVAEGVDCKKEDFLHVSPYAFEHIIPYGQYFFNLRQKERQNAYTEAQKL